MKKTIYHFKEKFMEPQDREEECGKLYKTMDYDKFSKIHYNREVSYSHVKRLIESLKNNPDDLKSLPIMVNKDMEIIDGQHRLEAARKLGVPVYYTIDEHFKPSKIAILNTTQKRWLVEDFIKMWKDQGNEHYEKLSSLMEELEWPFRAFIVWIAADGASNAKLIKSGEFKYNLKPDTVRHIVFTSKVIKFVLDYGYKPKHSLFTSHFHRAMRDFLNSGIVDYDRFLNRLERVPYKFQPRISYQDWMSSFADIYNWDMKSRIHVNHGSSQSTVSL